MELTPIGVDRFVVAGTPIVVEFAPVSAGAPHEVHVTGTGKAKVSHLVSPFTPSPAQVRALQGSTEVRRCVHVHARAISWWAGAACPGRADVQFQPVFENAFAGDMLGVLKFSRGTGGVVTGFTAKSDGARRLAFDRIRPQ